MLSHVWLFATLWTVAHQAPWILYHWATWEACSAPGITWKFCGCMHMCSYSRGKGLWLSQTLKGVTDSREARNCYLRGTFGFCILFLHLATVGRTGMDLRASASLREAMEVWWISARRESGAGCQGSGQSSRMDLRKLRKNLRNQKQAGFEVESRLPERRSTNSLNGRLGWVSGIHSCFQAALLPISLLLSFSCTKNPTC